MSGAASPADLLIPAAQRVGLALAGGLGAVAFAAPRRSDGGRLLFAMWRTWLVAGPLYVLGVVPSVWTATGLAVALAVQGLRELAGLGRLAPPDRRLLVALGALLVACSPFAGDASLALAALAVAGLVARPLLAGDTRDGVRALAWSALGIAVVALPLSSVPRIRGAPGGAGLLLAIGTGVALSDVAAFAVGRALGGRPLAPRVSPAKTRAGLAGNVVGAVAGVQLMAFALPDGLATAGRLALPLAIAAGAAWGDLLESLLKRHAGVKDAGRLLPGFGGLLDRIDSLLVALPLAHLVVEASR